MLKILPARLQQYVSWEFPNIQLDLEMAAGLQWITLSAFIGSWLKQGNSRKTSTWASLTMLNPLTVWDHNKLWKILKEMRVPDLSCLLRTGHGIIDWFKTGKGCVLAPKLFNFYAEYIMWNMRLDESSWTQSTLNIHWKDRYWSWSSKTLATWCKDLTYWKRPRCWERMKAKGEGGPKGEMVR